MVKPVTDSLSKLQIGFISTAAKYRTAFNVNFLTLKTEHAPYTRRSILERHKLYILKYDFTKNEFQQLINFIMFVSTRIIVFF